MQETPHLPEIVILLSAAVVIVALFRLLRISPLLGYLAAGMLIGPYGVGIIEHVEATSTFAEFGVLFLLFLIGLELSIDRLRMMRRHVFGFGTAQLIVTALILSAMLNAYGIKPEIILLLGSALALSSTAVVLEVLQEQGERSSQVGRLSLAVLILQDLAVIPLLVIVPYLGSPVSEIGNELFGTGIKALGALILIFILGRLFLRPAFRFIASLESNELFSATALLVVLGTSTATYAAGLSAAMGAFMAGLLIAETEFRHQVEADILPFKGLLMGLFFMTVGMSLDLRLFEEEMGFVLGASAALMASKAVIIILLCRAFGFGLGASIQAGLVLAQGGEFAFVLFKLADAEGAMPTADAQLWMVVVTITMALTPPVAFLGKWIARRIGQQTVRRMTSSIAEETLDIKNHVVICGFGRVGHTIARLLEAENIRYIALDVNAGAVAAERLRGQPVYYGDGSRSHVLKAIGIERASAVIITHSDIRTSRQTILSVREFTRDIPVIARAKNIEQVQRLESAGANMAVAEMFETSLQLGGALLRTMDIGDHEVSRIIEVFRAEDYALTRMAETSDIQ